MISLQNISKNYEGHVALHDVSFAAQSGKILGLLGPNGAGKTSLLRIMTHILLPDTGQVLFNLESLTEKHLGQIGYLPEERGLYPKMRANEHLVFLASLRKIPKATATKRITNWANRLELGELLNRKVENLSKGQQQKIQLIAALLHDPAFIILDEPFSGFDPVNAELLKNIIFQLKEEGRTLLISTHRMENAEEICDDIVMLNKGEVVVNGTKEELLKDQHRLHFLVKGTSEITNNTLFDVLGKQGEETEIRLLKETNPNEVLQQLLGATQIQSFRPKEKTLKEIFLENV